VTRRRFILLLVTVQLLVIAYATTSASAPTIPNGLSAYAKSNGVVLAWQPQSGAEGYRVYRGTSSSNITTLVSGGTITPSTYTDTSASNGTKYYYAVKAVFSGVETAASTPASATEQAATCSGNAIAAENCLPGGTGWKIDTPASVGSGGIEGFATATSVNAGGSVNLKVNTADGAPYRIEVWRTGWYAGNQGRLVGTMEGLTGNSQPTCQSDSTTGLVDCSNWSVEATLTTTTDWVTGVYLLRLVRTDNGEDNEILLTVRNDGAAHDGIYQVPVSTYNAYNDWGGKSLYDFNSSGPNTVSGTARAVKVSFDRPEDVIRDWYTQTDVEDVSWLEREGYDLGYVTSVDLQTGVPGLNSRKALILGQHDEYWSTEMRNAAKGARDAGVGLFFEGANSVYWKIRYESSAISGTANRVETCYKSTQSGGPDPSGVPTGTWRDPAGANAPENALVGQQYIGDNNFGYFPMQVSAAQGKSRVWRYTSLTNLAAGASDTIGQNIVGWEWDARASNGQEPAGVQTVAASPVNGELLTDAGKTYNPSGTATQNSTLYKAASGATVFSSGTNHWGRGLATNALGEGEPTSAIMQATANVLSDMGARPTTPAVVTLDASGAAVVSSHVPASNATGVSVNSSVTATFDRSLDPSTVSSSGLTLTGPGGASVAGTVTYDDSTHTVTLNPTQALSGSTTYTATVATSLKGWNGQGVASPVTWTFSTGGGTPPQVTSTTPADGATGVGAASDVRATFDRALTASTVNSSTFTLSGPGGASVAGTVSYDSATSTARLVPSSALSASTQYTATLTTGIKGADGTPMAAPVTWSFTTANPLQITAKTPASGAIGVAPRAAVVVTFDRSADPTTLTSSTFTLKDSLSQSVASTITYDDVTHRATLTPNAALATSATYTAALTTGVKAADGSALSPATSWSFTTASSEPAAPTTTSLLPAAGATGVAIDTKVSATFNMAMDASTFTGQSFTLKNGATVIAGTISYASATQTATITPSAPLDANTTYTATLTTAVRSATGEPLAANVSWTFTTVNCPCDLMGSSTPTVTGLATQDGRGGSGPFTYELGTKFQVTKSMQATGVRFYKSTGETGTHVGRLWSSTGTQLATVTFSGETASGWQRANFSSAVNLTANTTYTISVGFNAKFSETEFGLQSQLTSGPLKSVADGANGVYATSSGNFPSLSYHATNYFVDVVVTDPAAPPQPPHVVSRSPLAGATGVSRTTNVTATFDTSLTASTVTTSSFTLTPNGGSAIAASVSYDDASKTATLTPSAPLAASTTYTARLTTAIKSADGVAMTAADSWTFTTASASAPTVTSTSPVSGATNITPLTKVSAVFSMSLSPTSVSSSTATLTGPGGASVAASVAYDDPTHTVTITPSAALAASTTYTAKMTTGIRSTDNVAMGSDYTWTFTTSACPCNLFASTLTPTSDNLPTQDGRSGSGPWTYELGTKIQVSQPARIEAIRFWKASSETGTHVARVWNASGTQLATVTFSGESASGWQQQSLSTPLALSPGQTYIVSVGFNTAFGMTANALGSAITAGPLSSVADGNNGVYALTAGVFPTNSWNNSNYFVDAVVR
jgi:hypothetical protein